MDSGRMLIMDDDFFGDKDTTCMGEISSLGSNVFGSMETGASKANYGTSWDTSSSSYTVTMSAPGGLYSSIETTDGMMRAVCLKKK